MHCCGVYNHNHVTFVERSTSIVQSLCIQHSVPPWVQATLCYSSWLLQNLMVLLCTGDKPAFSKSTVDKSAKTLLNRMGAEDVAADAPNAADWVRLQR